jgi:hypothetical protein
MVGRYGLAIFSHATTVGHRDRKNLLATERLLVFCTFPEASMLVSSCIGIEGAFLATERVHKLESRMWLPDLVP